VQTNPVQQVVLLVQVAPALAQLTGAHRPAEHQSPVQQSGLPEQLSFWFLQASGVH
jgi:hypothetical protein